MKFIFLLLYISCSSVPERSEISPLVDEVLPVLDKMPDTAEKKFIKSVLLHAKTTDEMKTKQIQELKKETKKQTERANDSAETAGQWKGIRNASLMIGGFITLLLSIRFLTTLVQNGVLKKWIP